MPSALPTSLFLIDTLAPTGMGRMGSNYEFQCRSLYSFNPRNLR